MTTIKWAHLFLLFFVISLPGTGAETRAGFFLPDDVSEVTIQFQRKNNLIVLPVVINDSIKVNLILDTGCRNLVLFGKKFQKLLKTEPDKNITFSGLGKGKAIVGKLSLNNKVSISTVIGELIPVVLIPQPNLFVEFPNIHGVIGYDIFVKFEIEINPRKQLISFRPASTAILNPAYQMVPIRVEDSRPFVQSKIFLAEDDVQACDLMLDTGSSLGLLVKTSKVKKLPNHKDAKVLGRGFNGSIIGIETTAKKLLLHTLEISGLQAGIIYSEWHNYASMGMDVMKDYTIVLNYCKSYAGFRKVL
jgi:hypothetical protein